MYVSGDGSARSGNSFRLRTSKALSVLRFAPREAKISKLPKRIKEGATRQTTAPVS